MENIFYNDHFFNDLTELLEYEEIEKEEIEEKTDDYFIEVGVGELEPIIKFDVNHFIEYTFDMNEERFPEDADEMLEKIAKVLEENIDFAKLNELMPKLYYDSGPVKIFKSELLEAF
jgi:hypothetical protein